MQEYESISKKSLLEFLRLPLPSEIKRVIYEEHFKPAIIYDRLMKQFYSDECRNLISTNLIPMVQYVIKTPNLLKFVRQKNKLFSRLYQEHYIENQKYFILMDELTSMSLTWLMYMYH